ncbi:carboxypeptidase-like regulatory domain-containing protein [Pedobacter sp. P26]|uniref:carboxypeptidase-like regulatory domain-containing protein n=1 Tax=Pedobacter sp. P26 TaxID=3423956 RepID=UPI003D66596F
MIKKIQIKLKGYITTLVLLLFIHVSYAQDQKKVTGKVTDEKGEVLVGVSVRVKGSNTGTSTDKDGNYTLQAAPAAILVFSYVGFSNQEAGVNATGVVDVKMAGDKQLDEVVVVGYGTAKKRISQVD